MKKIKSFKQFEAVIMPPKSENNMNIRSYEDAVEYGRQREFDVVEYDEFYNSLGEADKKTAPLKGGVPFFALFHPERKRPMFVVCDTNVFRFMPMKEIMDDIIGHEMVHAEQTNRRGGIEFNLPDPRKRKAYFSNKEEVMAFSFTIANEISKSASDFESAKKLFIGGRIGGQAGAIWNNIKSVCDEDIIKRYKKYIYMYLEKMFDGEEVKPSVNPFKELDDRVNTNKNDLDYSGLNKMGKEFVQSHKGGRYDSPADLEKIGFKQMPQDERIKIIMDIIDNSPSPSKFMDYFSSEDMRIIKDRMRKR